MQPNASSPASILSDQIQRLASLHAALLVKEFRLRQDLLDLARQEQAALAAANCAAVEALQAGKQAILVELSCVEQRRRALIQGLSAMLEGAACSELLPTSFSDLEQAANWQMESLQNGILVLEGTTGELMKANQSLLALLP
jgi:hypothetical protein